MLKREFITAGQKVRGLQLRSRIDVEKNDMFELIFLVITSSMSIDSGWSSSVKLCVVCHLGKDKKFKMISLKVEIS